MRATWVVVGVVFVVGCMSRAEFKRAERADASVPDDVLYRAAVRVMVDDDLPIEDKDPEAGLITTEWQKEGEVLDQIRRVRWRITVDNGKLEVSSDCQMGSKDNWDKCQSGQQPEGRTAAAADLADRIMVEARRTRAPPTAAPARVEPATPAPPPVTAPPPAPSASPPPQ